MPQKAKPNTKSKKAKVTKTKSKNPNKKNSSSLKNSRKELSTNTSNISNLNPEPRSFIQKSSPLPSIKLLSDNKQSEKEVKSPPQVTNTSSPSSKSAADNSQAKPSPTSSQALPPVSSPPQSSSAPQSPSPLSNPIADNTKIDKNKWTVKGQVVEKPPANYISKIKKEDKALAPLTQEQQQEIKISEEKIKKLLDVQHIEELFFLISILSEKQIEIFLEHYKKAEFPTSPDTKVDSLVKQSKNKMQLEKLIKNAIAENLKDDHQRIRQKISELRKKGADVFVEDMRTLSLPQKIKFFLTTSKKEDFYKVKKILQEVTDELKKIEETIPKKE